MLYTKTRCLLVESVTMSSKDEMTAMPTSRTVSIAENKIEMSAMSRVLQSCPDDGCIATATSTHGTGRIQQLQLNDEHTTRFCILTRDLNKLDPRHDGSVNRQSRERVLVSLSGQTASCEATAGMTWQCLPTMVLLPTGSI